jgi:AraC-like DNA-binding protein
VNPPGRFRCNLRAGRDPALCWRVVRSRRRLGESERIPRSVRLYDAATLARLCRARDFLAARFDRRVPLADAAREAFLSPFYFGRLFAEAFGETPHEFVTRLRIDRAKRLLLSDGASVTDICFDVGYESLGSFSARFHSLTGLSPAAFRREGRRTFGGFRSRWPLFYVPACFQYFYLRSETPQESRSASPLL